MYVDLECHGCGKPFKRTRKNYNNSKRLGRKNQFCGQACLHRWQSEEFRKERLATTKTVKEKLPDGKKRCYNCREIKSTEEFGKEYGKKGYRRLRSYCRPCLYNRQKIRWHTTKIKAVEYLGTACSNCGIKGHPAMYDFHHRNPSKKEFEWVKLKIRSWDKIIRELDKCDLLCANCHRMEHINEELWKIP